MSDKKPTLSVVVPAYNVERYIEAAIDSTLEQTEPFHEVIVVNDGSTDATASRLEKYARHPTVRIVHTRNQGLGPARNEGVGRATGDFVYFLDSDDILPPHFVTTIGSILGKTPDLDLIFFSGEIFFDDDYRCPDNAETRPDEFRRDLMGIYASGLDAAAAMLRTGKFSPSACLYVSRRTLWSGPLRFKPIIHEDDELILRLCALARGARVVDEVLYKRRMRNGSIMSTRTTRRNAVGYFAALTSTWNLCQRIAPGPYKPVLLKHFKFQIWQYLHACRRAQVTPTLAELAYLARRFRYVPAADLLRTLLPLRVRAAARGVLRPAGAPASSATGGASGRP